MADSYNDEIEVRTGAGIVTLNAGYEHCKGGLYFAMQVAKDDLTGRLMVIYRKKDTPDVCALLLHTEDKKGWLDLARWPDGSFKPRFLKTTWFYFMHGAQQEKGRGKK